MLTIGKLFVNNKFCLNKSLLRLSNFCQKHLLLSIFFLHGCGLKIVSNPLQSRPNSNFFSNSTALQLPFMCFFQHFSKTHVIIWPLIAYYIINFLPCLHDSGAEESLVMKGSVSRIWCPLFSMFSLSKVVKTWSWRLWKKPHALRILIGFPDTKELYYGINIYYNFHFYLKYILVWFTFTNRKSSFNSM